MLVEFDDGGLGIGSQLSGSSAEGVGRLQRMAALNAATAPATLTDVDVELPMNGLARDLDLELLGDVGLVERAAAVGAAVRQGRLVDLVDLLGAGRLAVGRGAVVLAGLAAGLLGLVDGLALGEGGSLALAGTGRLVELAAEALVLGLEVAEASLKGLAAGTRDGLHTSIIGKAKPQLHRLQLLNPDQLELDALNKYPRSFPNRPHGFCVLEARVCEHRLAVQTRKRRKLRLPVGRHGGGLLVPLFAGGVGLPAWFRADVLSVRRGRQATVTESAFRHPDLPEDVRPPTVRQRRTGSGCCLSFRGESVSRPIGKTSFP